MQTKEKKKKTCTWTDTQIHEWELVISSLNGTQSGDGGGNVDSYENCEKLDTILNWWIHVDNDEHSRSSQSRKYFHFIPRKLYHSKYPPTDRKKVNDFQRIHISLYNFLGKCSIPLVVYRTYPLANVVRRQKINAIGMKLSTSNASGRQNVHTFLFKISQKSIRLKRNKHELSDNFPLNYFPAISMAW